MSEPVSPARFQALLRGCVGQVLIAMANNGYGGLTLTFADGTEIHVDDGHCCVVRGDEESGAGFFLGVHAR